MHNLKNHWKNRRILGIVSYFIEVTISFFRTVYKHILLSLFEGEEGSRFWRKRSGNIRFWCIQFTPLPEATNPWPFDKWPISKAENCWFYIWDNLNHLVKLMFQFLRLQILFYFLRKYSWKILSLLVKIDLIKIYFR